MIQEYECNVCRSEFNMPKLCRTEAEVDVKCPVCGSKDIRKLDANDNFLDKISKLMSSGGG